MKNILHKIYILAFMVLTVYFISIIWDVTFHHIFEEYHNRKEYLDVQDFKEKQQVEEGKSTFEKVILESEERVKRYLGYRVIEEQRIEGHFHHIGFDIGPDKRSYCVTCHGDIPHDNVKEIRAFLNMHAFFIGCQTCHVKADSGKETGVYKWYDRKTGEIVVSPVPTHKAGTYGAKIIPFERHKGELRRIDTQELIDFAGEFKVREETLSEAQKSKAKKVIHNIVSEKAHVCEDCHQNESPLLPLKELGYPEDRVNSILSTEVVGMIKKYTEFYMPRMLHPGQSESGTEK